MKAICPIRAQISPRYVEEMFVHFGSIRVVHGSDMTGNPQRDELRKIHPKVKAKANEAIYQQSPKILIRQTGARLIAAMDWQSSGHQRSLLALASEHIETLQLVLLILNHDWTNEILQGLSINRAETLLS